MTTVVEYESALVSGFEEPGKQPSRWMAKRAIETGSAWQDFA
jgi:hypothetical protein